MPKKTWNVTVDNQGHEIEFKFGLWTNRRSILVDGSQIELPKEQRRIQWDTGTRHEFEVAGHKAVIATRSSGFSFEPHLYIDGKNAETGLPISFEDQTGSGEEAIRTRRTGVLVILSLAGIGSIWLNARMLLSSGSYFPFLAMVGPASLVLAVYYAIFQEDPWELPKPIPFRMITMFILAFGLGAANWWASDNGLYFLLFSSG